MAAEFPFRAKDTKVMEEGLQVFRAQCYQTLRNEAQEIIDRKVSEAADSAVIYYHDSWRIAYISERTSAIEDVLGDDPREWGAVRGVSDVITKIAYYAYSQDLREMIDAFQNTE